MSDVVDLLAPMTETSRRARAKMLRRLDVLRTELADDGEGFQKLLHNTRDLWAAICREVIAGRTDSSHAERDRLQQTIEESLLTIRDWLPIARAVITSPGRKLLELGTMAQEAEGFWNRIFDRWKTPEDLEDLVANATAPTPEQLDAMTRKYGFPHVWHAADDSPV